MPLCGASWAAQLGQDQESGEVDLVDPNKKTEKKEPQTLEEMANFFYAECVKSPYSMIQPQDVEMYCGCRSVKMMEVMSLDELKSTLEQTPEGKFQRTRLAYFVDVPCVAYPAMSLVLDQCLGDVETVKTMKQPRKTCRCLAQSMGAYIKTKGVDSLMQERMLPGHAEMSAEEALLERPLFNSKMKEFTRKCVAIHEQQQDLY